MNVASNVARATVITSAQRLRRNIYLVNVQCSAYQMILTSSEPHDSTTSAAKSPSAVATGKTATATTATTATTAADTKGATTTRLDVSKDLVGQKVLHVPLGSVVTPRQAKQWRIEWHCCESGSKGMTKSDTDGNNDNGQQQQQQRNTAALLLLRVVPRLIDGCWSQGAIVPNYAPEQPPTDEQYAAGVEHILYAYTVPLPSEMIPLSQPRPFVDLLQNRRLLRALLRVRVVIQFVPAIDSAHDKEDAWHCWRDERTQMQLSAIWHGCLSRRRALVYDAKAACGAALSAQQLLRLSKRSDCGFQLLPLLSKDNETLYSFVSHNERFLHSESQPQGANARKVYASGGGGNSSSSNGSGGKRFEDARRQPSRQMSQQQMPFGRRRRRGCSTSLESERAMDQRHILQQHGVNRGLLGGAGAGAGGAGTKIKQRSHRQHLGQHYNDVDDWELDLFAQRLLRIVDQSVPGDAVGIIVRPFDVEATAYIEQKCPYMMCKVAAFVPALSRLWPRPDRKQVLTHSSLL